MTTRAIPTVDDLEEGYSQRFVDSYETAPISVVDETAIADKTFTFYTQDQEVTVYLTAEGMMLRNGQRYGAWSVEPLERPDYTTFQQPGKWTQLVHQRVVDRVILMSFGGNRSPTVEQMVVLRDDSTGLIYLQERNSAFQNINGEIVMANFYGEKTIWGST